jgi:catechol 2,3-dioxygenase-like lactoylglutathione lyase family enzyme
MSITKFDHFFVFSEDIESTAKFYENALGLRRGARPPFGFPGEWMYLDGLAIVHIGPTNESRSLRSTGPVGHIAFSGTDYQAQMDRLSELQIPVQVKKIPQRHQCQIFFEDPNGIRIEIDYPIEIEGSEP